MNTYSEQDTQTVYFWTNIVWFILATIEALLLLRFLLKLFAVDSSTQFTEAMYNATDLLLGPFSAIFSVSYVSNAIFEWTTLVAALIYYTIGTAIINLIMMREHLSLNEANQRLIRQE